MKTVKTIKEICLLVKEAKSQGKLIGFVPTMGALHEGHLSLVRAAVEKCDYVVVSIFVNPTQFGAGEDLDKYPKPIENDLQLCRQAGVDVVFNPSADQMYREKNITWVSLDKITDLLCGASRPGHFRGVTTVCAKFFNIVAPDYAFFGQKDAQQAIVIKRMVVDLNMPIEIVVCPIVRESDGLAMSSRNVYLSQQERKDAVLIYQSLQKCRQMIEKGVRNSQTLADDMRKILRKSGLIEVEYISIVDTRSLEKLEIVDSAALVAVAARLGTTRLIDNILVD